MLKALNIQYDGSNDCDSDGVTISLSAREGVLNIGLPLELQGIPITLTPLSRAHERCLRAEVKSKSDTELNAKRLSDFAFPTPVSSLPSDNTEHLRRAPLQILSSSSNVKATVPQRILIKKGSSARVRTKIILH
mmetsp:Transcript_12057/g.16846  ORF Transcript_12057/g.16846 Transcript_12057/m.16846 type:complete len:134 (+) Transcript_12057:43-444(+)